MGIWAQLEAARGKAEEKKRQLATAQVSVSARPAQHAATKMGPHLLQASVTVLTCHVCGPSVQGVLGSGLCMVRQIETEVVST